MKKQKRQGAFPEFQPYGFALRVFYAWYPVTGLRLEVISQFMVAAEDRPTKRALGKQLGMSREWIGLVVGEHWRRYVDFLEWFWERFAAYRTHWLAPLGPLDDLVATDDPMRERCQSMAAALLAFTYGLKRNKVDWYFSKHAEGRFRLGWMGVELLRASKIPLHYSEVYAQLGGGRRFFRSSRQARSRPYSLNFRWYNPWA